jgi:hypothetical protein
LIVQAFGEPIETIADCNTRGTGTGELDTLDLASSAQQGMDWVGTDTKNLLADLTWIDPAESLSSPLHHGGKVPGSSNLSTATTAYAYTMALERQVEQLRRKVALMERQQWTAGGAANAFHALSQENARLTAENRRLVALLGEMDSLRERNKTLQRQVEELSKSVQG